MSSPGLSGEEDRTDNGDTRSKRFQTFPSDLFEEAGVHCDQLASLGADAAAKVVDVLHSVRLLLPSNVRS